jgi:telomeric repeat-binding factor 2
MASRFEKGVSLNTEEVRGQPTTRGTAGPSAPNDKDKGSKYW